MKKLFSLFSFSVLLALSAAAQNGYVGIGTNAPNSRLHVNGSLAAGYRVVTASATLDQSDYALEFTGSSAATITLPNDSFCKGRIYTIKNNGTGSPTPVVTISPYPGQTIDGKSTWSLRRTNETITLISTGTTWNVQVQEVNLRSNYVLVKSEADFPAPVSGVVTLTAGTLYEINGTILVSSKIDLNDCTIMGKDRNNDRLVYVLPFGELFTGANGGTLYNLTVLTTSVGAKLFNIDAGGSLTKALLLQLVYVFNCDNVGLIKGIGGFVIFQSVAFSNNTNGIILQDIGNFVEINTFWIEDNHNTYQKMVGSFEHIFISGGEFHVLSAFSAKGLDVSGITSISDGAQLKACFFAGDGTLIVGTLSSAWEVESDGIPTEKDDVAAGNIYISSATATTFSGANTPTKVLGTTTAVGLFRVSSAASNRLAYTGIKTKRFLVICSLTLTASSNNKVYSFYISKNGIIMPESKQTRKVATGSDQSPMPISCTVSMSTNDYIEVWAENNTDNTTMTVGTMNIAIK